MSEVLPVPCLDAARSDADLLRSLRWTSGPQGLTAAARRGDVPAFAKAFGRELARRFGRKGGDPERLAARFPLHETLALAAYRRLADPGADAAEPPADPVARLVRLGALLDGLRRFGGRLGAEALAPLWREAWTETATLAERPVGEDSPLAHVLTAEILWASGVLFDGVSGMRPRRKLGRERLLAEFEARTDTDGTPHAEMLPILPAWLASVTRCVAWAKAGDVRLWGGGFSGRYDGLLRSVATLAEPDGRLSLTSEGDVRPALADGVKRSGLKADSPVRRLVTRLREQKGLPPVPTARDNTAPHKSDKSSPPVVQSDWAKLAVARTRWRPEADLFAITHHAATPSVEFAAFGRGVFAGEWGLRIRLDGEEVPLTPEWEAVTWFSDEDADYLELQWPNERGVTVCRQALLTRGDHQLVIADAVSTPARPEARIEVEAALPLAAGVTAEPRRPLREVRLDALGLPLRCFPVALPMDRIEQAPGSLESEGRRLVMRRAGAGGVYLPLVLDWNPRRRDAFADWRTLTVTEDRRRLGPAEASGHRLRVGSRQLLVYRGLNGSKAMRAVLGYHHGSESVIARFTSEGDVEPLVLVE